MKRMFSLLIILCMLFPISAGLSSSALAVGNVGYDTLNPENSLKQRVCDFNYTYNNPAKSSNYQPYQSRYMSNPQCVSYAYARIEEKLNLLEDE